MVFHQNFYKKEYYENVSAPQWFEQRSKLYAEVAKWDSSHIKEIYFDFSEPDCGWMDITIYLDGKRIHTFPISQCFDPFFEMKVWMEDIVNDFKLGSDLYIEVDGRTIIMHYEHICLASLGCGVVNGYFEDKEPEWEEYDTNSCPDIGLFYLYDSGTKSIPVVCICKTKQFLFSLYNGLLAYAARSKSVPLIGKEWYYADHDDDGNPTENNWTLYNTIKSQLIEWNYDSGNAAYRHKRPQFKEVPPITETVHMWAEWGDGLFWHQRGGCCGNAEGFFVDAVDERIDLSDLPELRIWYDEFDNSDPCGEWEENTFNSWFQRGWLLAKKVRKRLPESVDLFYHWKAFKLEDNEWSKEIPIIVRDERNIIKKRF
jgi:hypothetical protein